MADITKIDDFIQSSPHPAWLATTQGNCVYANPALERLTGFNSDRIKQADWRSFLLEEDRAVASASWQRSLATGTPYRVQIRMRGSDDVPKCVDLFAFGHKAGDGAELWLFTGVDLDGVAAQKRPELEAQIQATLNVIPPYTWYALPSGELTFVNERTANYLGLPKDHLLRFGIDAGAEWDSHTALLHPDDREEARRVWSTCLSTGTAGEFTFRVPSAEGKYRWFLTRAEPLRANDGALLYWIGVNLDIADAKRAQEALRKSQFYLAEGQRLAHTGSWTFNADGFEFWSSELFRIYGLEPTGKPPTVEEYLALVHPEDRGFMKQGIAKMLDDHLAFDFTKRIVRPDGEIRHIRCVGIPVTQGGIFRGFLGTGMDVTEQQRLTEELRLGERYLADGQRLAPMGS